MSEHTSGAALFVDMSGFTRLTEVLSQELGPQRGSEEITHHLNRMYGVLIDEVERYGGNVISFTGDAITCWFDRQPPSLPTPTGATQGDAEIQAARRAVACALAMQQKRRRNPS